MAGTTAKQVTGGRAKRSVKGRAAVSGRKPAPQASTGASSKRKMSKPAKSPRRWSAKVMRTSDAMDLEKGVFTRRSPRSVAVSLKRSAEQSARRKSAPFRSAMSMLNFEINRAGRGMSAAQRDVLERAKQVLRGLFGRDPAGTRKKAPGSTSATGTRASKAGRAGSSPPRKAVKRKATSAKARTTTPRRRTSSRSAPKRAGRG